MSISVDFSTSALDFRKKHVGNAVQKNKKVGQMKRFWLGIAALTAVSACGGDGTNPFTPKPDIVEPEGIPEDLKGDLDAYSYDPATQTLTVTGLPFDPPPANSSYQRRPGLDRNGYEAYTAQVDPSTRHFTGYAKQIDKVSAAVVLSGGQFDRVIGGTSYGRDGNFDPPAGGSVTYAGKYVGLLNASGDGSTLPDTDIADAVKSREAAEVTGSATIIADFTNNAVDGGITDRTLVDRGITLSDLSLTVTDITENGTFTGQVSQTGNVRGTYGGIFGGTDASAVAGSLFVEGHIDGIENELEYGIFVLQNCGPGNADPNCP